MKHVRKMIICLVTLLVFAIGSTAVADSDDNYPWQAIGGKLSDMRVMSRLRGGSYYVYSAGNISNSSDTDYYFLNCGRLYNSQGLVNKVTINFTHATGDLDIEVYSVEGELLGISQGTSDSEVLSISWAARSTAVLKVYGYNGATNGYDVALTCQ